MSESVQSGGKVRGRIASFANRQNVSHFFHKGLEKFGRPEIFLVYGLIVACTLIAFAAASAYENSQQAIENERSAERSLQLLSTLESLFLVVKDLNSQALSYEKNPDPPLLEKYERAKKALANHLRSVNSLADNKARRSRHLSYLQWLIVSLEKRCDEIIESARNRKAIPQGPSTSEQLQLIRNRIVYIQLDERRLVSQKVIESERDSKEAAARFIALAVFIPVLFVMLIFMSQRHMRVVRASAEAEKKIRRSITENAPLGVLILTQDYSIVNANTTFANYLGLDAAAVTGQSLFELVPELESRTNAQTELERSDAPTKRALGTLLVRVNNEERLWTTSQWTVTDETNNSGFILLVQDVTEQARLTRQKELLVETIAHDLKTPLIASRYTLESVIKMESDAQKSILLSEIDESVDDVLNMVRNLLELSRYDEGAEVLSIQVIDVNAAVADALDAVQRLARSYEIILSYDRADGPLNIKADHQAIVHLLSNLCTNAIKFSPSGSRVTISAEPDHGNAVIKVSDSGPGISEEEQAKLFNRFGSGGQRARIIGSTGLGLYLSQEIVRAHHGQISCQTTEGKGTTFIVVFPQAEV